MIRVGYQCFVPGCNASARLPIASAQRVRTAEDVFACYVHFLDPRRCPQRSLAEINAGVESQTDYFMRKLREYAGLVLREPRMMT